MAKYREEHREEKKSYLREYYQKNKQRLLALKKEQRKEEKQLRRARELDLPITYQHLRKIYLKAHPIANPLRQGRHKKREQDLFTARAKIWYQEHKDNLKLARESRKVEIARKVKSWRLQVKVEVLTHYGNDKLACVKCGENRLPCLSIDHIDGGGGKHRKKLFGVDGKSIYYWLIENNFPEGYQTLCMNCQFIKQAEMGNWYV